MPHLIVGSFGSDSCLVIASPKTFFTTDSIDDQDVGYVVGWHKYWASHCEAGCIYFDRDSISSIDSFVTDSHY